MVGGYGDYRYYERLRWSPEESPVSTVLAFFGLFLVVVFFSLSVATGLLYLAELTEEYTHLTRRILKLVLKIVIGLHLLLLLFDPIPVSCVMLGLAAHLFYFRIMKTFPYVHLASYDFIGTAATAIVSNIVWTRFLWTNPQFAYVSLEYRMGLMLFMAWLIPFTFLFSLTTTDQVLPVGSGTNFPSRGKQHRITALSSLLNFVRNRRDEILPTVIAQDLGSERRRQL